MNSLRPLHVLRSAQLASPVTCPQVRHFHPTKPARLINEVVETSTGLIHGVHSLSGLPWVASIPLTAVLVRMVVALPLQIYTRINSRRDQDLNPLLHSWREFYQKQAQSQRLGAAAAKTKVQVSIQNRGQQLRSRWNVSSYYRPANFLQVPIWISLMESLRAMCGNENGLLSMLHVMFKRDFESSSAVGSLPLNIEPSLANEGALWFPDLLAGDPTGILPAVLTASILLNVRTGWNTTPLTEAADMPALQMYRVSFFNGLRVFIQVLALNVGISSWFYGMPTALMIYWITSTNVATLQTMLLGKYMFLQPPFPPYKKMYYRYSRPGTSDPFMTKLR
ncbi:mitochondrial export translocase Oxa2 [Penicillium alfredii]|uniref:Mitochondrial export translocase Oxa2 n=1 Tax=Penicillium alfredii TaxID=1506179 RepID=A0A9W9JWU2_9EURO|nr:mitochondrial export translocase Oxa2 [Penicillium alfredii]KAJ5084405.1 mitochondrial export translocase Oxa2 [Penicillium alfredii]